MNQKQQAIVPVEAQFFTPEQEQMILTTFLGGASKQEAQVLLATVRRRRLDPFSRQVYFVKRWDRAKKQEVWAIQTSIDGLRSIAERTGLYAGQDEPEYGQDEDGNRWCKVRVYRKDWPETRPAVGWAFEKEFLQYTKDGAVTQFWSKMPRLMLAKCAEALAIRKAFPEDTGGLYVAEEIGTEEAQEVEPTPRKDSVSEVVEKMQRAGKAQEQKALPEASGLLSMALAKQKWNLDHPDKLKVLTVRESNALSEVGVVVEQKEKPAPEKEEGDDIVWETQEEQKAREARQEE